MPPDNLEVLDDFSPLISKASSVLTVLERNSKVFCGVVLVSSSVSHQHTLRLLTSNKHPEHTFLILI